MKNSQTAKFKELAKYIFRNNRFYRQRFINAGIRSLRLLEDKDWREKVPLTSKNDLLADQQNHPPFGLNFAATLKNCFYIQSSSGTSTGKTFLIPYSSRDYRDGIRPVANFFKKSGIKSGDLIYFVMPPGATPVILDALKLIGAVGIPWNMYSNFQIVQALSDSKATIFWGTPSLMYNIINTAKEKGINLKDLSLRLIFLSAETITAEDCEAIARNFGVTCDFNFGATEFTAIGYSCRKMINGINYHMDEDSLYFEVIDPQTSKTSSKGEMVLTNLYRKDYPFLRYRTGNLVEIIPGKCACGNSGRKFRFLGRVDRQIRFYTRYILPDQLEAAIRRFPQVKDFSIELRKHLGLEFMYIKISLSSLRNAGISKKIKAEFIDQFDISPIIEIVPAGIYRQMYWKHKKLIDLRDQHFTIFHKDPEESVDRFLRQIISILHYRFIRPLLQLVYGKYG